MRMRACPEPVEGLVCRGRLRRPGARPSARSQRRAILAPGCARKPGGRTPVLSARRVPRLSSRLARQLAFLRKPMAAHGVPLLKRGFDGASCTAPPSAMLAATVRPAPHPAASGGGPRGMRTMGCAISTGRRGAAAGARFQVSSTHRQMSRAPQPQTLTGYLRIAGFDCQDLQYYVTFALLSLLWMPHAGALNPYV